VYRSVTFDTLVFCQPHTYTLILHNFHLTLRTEGREYIIPNAVV